MRYCFFGLNPGAMTKYPAGLARALAARDPDASFCFIVDDPSGLTGVEFPERSEFTARGAPRVSAIRRTIREIEPDVLITTAQRIPDSAYVTAAKQAGVFTAMFQHGLYLPFMKREISLFVTKVRKTFSYVRYAVALAEMHQRSRLRYTKELTDVFVRGKRYADAGIDVRRMNVDLVLLNGEYWRSFHSRQYGYSPEEQLVVGYPDYQQLPSIEAQERQVGVAYVAQTLVEHGRLSRSDFQGFLEEFRTALDGVPLVVKLHPASDETLYEPLRDLAAVRFTRTVLPKMTHYVGHYSTYLSMVPFLSQNLLLWELEGHPIPDSIRPAASVATHDAQVLRDFCQSEGRPEPDEASIAAWEHYFYRGDGRVFDRAAREILHRIR